MTTKKNRNQREPIAIVGIGCRFPGVRGTDEFWRLLEQGKEAISEVPSDRFDLERYFDPTPATTGKVSTRFGGFLQDVDKFDADFFGMAPREAERLDPQQRLLLEVAWEALEDAGHVPAANDGSRTGVFVGLWINDFEARMFQGRDDIDFYMTTGSGRYAASGRLSYFLGFQGPSVTIDTACSSSLVAVHLACQSLWSGESDMALAGGANVILQPHVSIAYSQSNMLSADGRCKFGAQGADGYVRSEGAGVVTLKTLARARKDQDDVYAVILGSAVNNDGRTGGFLATPGQKGQEDLLEKAYEAAGVSPGKASYVEAHGTGTSTGDPVEIQALGNILSRGRPENRPGIIGSVKTNIGHTEGAAGVAGLIKVALALKHSSIPGTLHLDNLNPAIPWQELPLTLHSECHPWPASDEPNIAGVSAFGIAGTNAHVVLQDAPLAERRENYKQYPRPIILPISAHSKVALLENMRGYQARILELDRSATDTDTLVDLCYTASRRRTHHRNRAVLIGENAKEINAQIAAFLKDEAESGVITGQTEVSESHKVVFVFPGQGSQWFGMARQLLQKEPAFRESMQECEEVLREFVDWSLLDQLSADESASRLAEINVIQPTLFSIQVSLATLWRSLGVEPDVVVGHSMGEVAASHIAGALSLADAAKIICRRSLLLRKTSGKGGMAVVELTIDQAEKALKGFEDKLSIAVSNSSRSTVLSGDPAALDEILSEMERKEIFCRRINVDVASHSPQMDPLREELLEAAADIKPRSAEIPVFSTVRGRLLDGSQLGPEYWADNLRQPVLFSHAIRALRSEGHDMFIEISPHPILLPAIQQELQDIEEGGAVVASMRREEDEQAVIMESLADLYVNGCPVRWQQLYPDGARYVRLPLYPWQRERFWIDEPDKNASRRAGSNLGHPLLGTHITSSVHNGTHFWETTICAEDLAYLSDHRVRGSVVFPAAAFTEFVHAGMKEVLPDLRFAIENMVFCEALFVPERAKDARLMQLVLSLQSRNTWAFKIVSRKEASLNGDDAWKTHVTGTVRVQEHKRREEPLMGDLADGIRLRCAEKMTRNQHYDSMQARNLNYGTAFRWLSEISLGKAEATGKLEAPPGITSQLSQYGVHPTILDACFQLLATTAASTQDPDEQAPLLPVSIERYLMHKPVPDGSGLSCVVRLKENESGDSNRFFGDIVLMQEDGPVLLEATGLELQKVNTVADQIISDQLYTVSWQQKAHEATSSAQNEAGNWLIFRDSGSHGQTLAAELQKRGQTCFAAKKGEAFKKTTATDYEVDPESPDDFKRLLSDVTEKAPLAGIVYLWSLDTPDNEMMTLEGLRTSRQTGSLSVLNCVQALGEVSAGTDARLWLITRGVHVLDESKNHYSASQAPLWGLGAVVAAEFPSLRCSRLDLSGKVKKREIHRLAEELLSETAEDQIALRGNDRYVSRLRPWTPEQTESVVQEKLEAAGGRAFRAETRQAGILDQLILRAFEPLAPKPGEVQIEVRASGLNFINVMSALGIYPGYPNGVGPLGIECAGCISAVGKGVTGFAPGDEVIAFAFDSLASHANVDARLVHPKPKYLTFEQAATIPIVFLTAHYALNTIGRMRAGEKALIHSAAGGLGLAAVQLAKRAGAVIFATSGTPEKRDYLKQLGIEHVMDSRSLTFVGEIMEATDGKGVDLVLNSLAGEAIPASLSVLGPYGRFVEVGKRDIYENSQIGLEPFRNSLSYSSVDLDHMGRERPEYVGELLKEVMEMLELGEIEPLPQREFAVGSLAKAFHHMARGEHIGKIAISLADKKTAKIAPPALSLGTSLNGSVLITGGLGGLGLTVAQWLAEQGARHLVLMGRKDPGKEARVALANIKKLGTQVTTVRADVADADDISKVITMIKEELPPLKGVVHAAGLLADATISQMNEEQFERTFPAKIDGSWNLHEQTRDESLDFFVLFSSVASLLGTAGQSNYAAANAFMDALAHHRRANGLCAMSINWGPWSEVGLAAADANRGRRLEHAGLGGISPQQGIEALQFLLPQKATQVAVMNFDSEQWRKHNLSAAASPMLSLLAAKEAGDTKKAMDAQEDIRAMLTAAKSGKKQAIMEQHLREQVAKVLRLAPNRIGLKQALRTLGLDSLMALEFRNRLESSLGLTLKATLFFNYPSIRLLAPILMKMMNISHDTKDDIAEDNETIQASDQDIEKMLAEIEGLTEEEIQQLDAEQE